MQDQITQCWKRWHEALKAGNIAAAVRERGRIANLEKVQGATRASRHAMKAVLPCLK